MKLDRLAVHEGSHALVVALLGGTVTTCGIKDGVTTWRGLTKLGSLRAVVAGHQGEKLLLPAEADPADADHDIETASRIAFSIVRHGEAGRLEALGLDEPSEKMLGRASVRAEKIIGHAEAGAARLLAANVGALRAIAARLMDAGTITDKQVAAIVAAARP